MMNYDEFINAAGNSLADNKEYDVSYDLNTAYKSLKEAIKKPDTFDYKNFQDPHYLKDTTT